MLAMIIVGCAKEDSDNKDDSKNNGKDDKDIIIMTADVNEIDYDRVWTYEGSNGSLNDIVGVKRESEEGLGYVFSSTDIKNSDNDFTFLLIQREGSSANLQKRKYSANDSDFFLHIAFGFESTTYLHYTIPLENGEVRQYNGGPLQPYYYLNITKLTDDAIEADFEFDAYTTGGKIIKAEVRNGKMKGRIKR